MKTQFVFNSRKYIAPSKTEAENFIKFWDSPFSKIFPLKTGWKINMTERAPGWVPIPVFDDDRIEYGKP